MVLQNSLFDMSQFEIPVHKVSWQKIAKRFPVREPIIHVLNDTIQIQSRRYLGNKYKLLGFIESVVSEKCEGIKSFCDIFAGTGVVGWKFNNQNTKIISNDILHANFVCLRTFLGINELPHKTIFDKISYLNNLCDHNSNYFSYHFGGTYFTEENARKIGVIREEIEHIAETELEKNVLICSLLYAVDKIANTVGHYDSYRKKLDTRQPLRLLIPDIQYGENRNNEIYKQDANSLIRRLNCDVLYLDPPYNSRQYSDAYHLLENLAEWKKPKVKGVAQKMDRSHIKSDYCRANATSAFADLIRYADCKHILLSYNSTGKSKDERSNARISDDDILRILNERGHVEIFETNYPAFTAGKSPVNGNSERIFYCKVVHRL